MSLKLSIITSCFNRESTIRDTIESVLSQNYPDIEYIIVDGASTDHSLSIINEYKKRVAKIISEPDKGMYEALNKGIKAATGDVIGLMHSDDFFYATDTVSRIVERMEQENAQILYGNGLYVDETDTNKIVRNWISGNYSKAKMQRGWLPLHPTVYIRRECFESAGLYDESFGIAADSDFLVRYLYEQNFRVTYLNEYIVRMRMGGLSTDPEKMKKKWIEDLRLYRNHGFNPYWALGGKILSKIPQFITAKLVTNKILLCIGISLFLASGCFAQFSKGITYEAETGISLSNGEHTPLWLTANKQGLGSIRKNNAYLMTGIFRPMEKEKTFTYGLGLEMAGTSRHESKFLIRQAYLDLKWHFLGATIGSKVRYGEFKNQQLSSGALTFSGNSLPIPQVKIGIPEYVAIPGTKNWLSVRGYIAYGIFTDGNWQESFAGKGGYHTKNVLFHDKAIFFKIGNDNKFPLTFDFGLEMPARFSGTLCNYTENGKKIDKHIPHRLKDFWNVLLPTSGDEQTMGADQTNILGDMLGSWHFSLNYQANDWNIRAYMEHQYNDHSQLFWEYSWKDGLWGLEATLPKNKFVSSIVYEYLYSKDQTGPIYWDSTQQVPDQISGTDDYYNHGYYAGWQHWGMSIGNPLFVSPVYNEDGSLRFRSNRLIAHHIGISGNPSDEWKYRILFSYADHWGTYNNPFEEVKYNANSLAEISYSPKQWKHWTFTGAVAADKSDYIGNSWGGMITVRFTSF